MEVLEIDVGGGRRKIERQQEESPKGHWVRTRAMLRIIPSGSGEKLYFERTLDFACFRMPTSFYVRIEFSRPFDTDVNCEISIERTDQGTGFVDATLMLLIRRRGRYEFTEKHVFSEVGPGGTPMPIIKDSIILNKRAQKLYSEPLLVELCIGVTRCHKERGMF